MVNVLEWPVEAQFITIHTHIYQQLPVGPETHKHSHIKARPSPSISIKRARGLFDVSALGPGDGTREVLTF